jgi:hypothetical protein
MHRIFGGMEGFDYIFGERIVLRSLAKDGYTEFLMIDGRLEAYLDNGLVWTSYFNWRRLCGNKVQLYRRSYD